DVGTRVEQHIEVYLYASSADLRQAMVYPQEWTGGVAFTEYGIIAIGMGPGDLEWGVRALRHELTHLVVHAATFSPYGNLPTWLDEGLAMYNEGQPATGFESILRNAVENEGLLSLRTLSGPFSADSTKAYLSYAQSHSVVEYLLGEYGSDRMHQLLMTFKAGATIDAALNDTYDIDLDELQSDWYAWVQQEYASV
ncbi:MAG: peptidase MA family metallohydrolase, partial [Chloroflexota bacterium]